jgi:xylulokinase
MHYTLGIDLGTSSLKVLLLRVDGTTIGSATRGYPISGPKPGWAEQDPMHWWEACSEAIRSLLAEYGVVGNACVAIGIGGQMHGTVLLDTGGSPLRPAIIWPDQRAVREAAEAEAALVAYGLLARLGGGVSPGFMLATLLWLRRHEPDTWARAHTALLPKDYLRYRLTGVLSGEASDGSGIPAIDLRSWQWSDDLLHALDLPTTLFPPLLPSTAVAGTLTEEVAWACGLQSGIPVLCGGSDQAMAAIGSGLLHPGTLLISISTGGQLVTPLAAPLSAPAHGLRTLCHALPEQPGGARTYLALAATLGAGLSFRWLRDQLVAAEAEDADAHLLGEAAQAPPGAGGLLFLPYLAGERAPLLDPSASGAFIGLRLDHGRAHLARAVLEAIAFSLRHALEPLQAAGVVMDRIVLAGGLAQSALMRDIMAGVLDQPVVPLEIAEQSALGAAILAAVHAGFFHSLEEACARVVCFAPPVLPDPAQAAIYQAFYPRYRGLYPTLRADMHALRHLQ